MKKAHLIRNKNFNISVIIQWLNSSFNLCVIVTFLWSFFYDFESILKIIENFDIWKYRLLIDWIIDEKFNFFDNFEIFIDHFAIALQCIINAFRKFVKFDKIDNTIKNMKMKQIWKTCFIKKFYDFRLFITIDKLIAKDIFFKCLTQSFSSSFEMNKTFITRLFFFISKIE